MGADAQAHLADVEAGVAVQGEDAVDPDEPAGRDDLGAPPGMSSSAGWKISRTPSPARASASAWVARARPAPRSAVVCRSWPQAWRRRRWCDAQGRPVSLRDRQGVQVGPQGDAVCGFLGAEVDDDAAALQEGGGQPGRGQAVGDDPAGPGLEAGQLGVRVEVATQTDELGFELVDGGVQDGKQWVHIGGQGYPAGQYAPPMVSGPAFVVESAVAAALAQGRGVVALESTILAHGLPRGDNRRVADEIEDAVRAGGAVPATVAVIDGVVRVGLSPAELDRLCLDGRRRSSSAAGTSASRSRSGATGATTVASTAALAHRAGIRVFATGGLGGVHRGAAETFDISADLGVLATTPVLVVCAGVKSILDVPATLERLETLSVPVLGYRTDRFPGFYLTDSGSTVPWRVESAAEAAAVAHARAFLGTDAAGVVLANPLPKARQVDPVLHDRLVAAGLAELAREGVSGKDVTPRLLEYFHENSGGESLRANVELVLANATLAAEVAVELAALHAGRRA